MHTSYCARAPTRQAIDKQAISQHWARASYRPSIDKRASIHSVQEPLPGKQWTSKLAHIIQSTSLKQASIRLASEYTSWSATSNRRAIDKQVSDKQASKLSDDESSQQELSHCSAHRHRQHHDDRCKNSIYASQDRASTSSATPIRLELTLISSQ